MSTTRYTHRTFVTCPSCGDHVDLMDLVYVSDDEARLLNVATDAEVCPCCAARGAEALADRDAE